MTKHLRKAAKKRAGSSMKRSTGTASRVGSKYRKGASKMRSAVTRRPRISRPSVPKIGLPKPYTGKGKKVKNVFKKGRTLVGTVLDSGAKNASDPEMRAAMGIAGDLVSKKKSRRKRGLKSGLAMAFKSI